MRSSYVGIYGFNKEITAAKAYGPIIKQYEKELEEYEIKRKTEPSVQPPKKPDNYDEMRSRYDGIIERDKNERDDGGPIMPEGAWRDPITGNTPKGLSKGLQNYQPTEWQV